MQRDIETRGWARFAYVCDINDTLVAMASGNLTAKEVNAASSATIIIDRMLRNGRSRWRTRMLNAIVRRYNNDGKTP